MTETEKIEREIGNIARKYEGSAYDIVSAYRGENELRNNYCGREIPELLQNADDCHTDGDKSVFVRFELRGGMLAVKNTGRPFDARGVISLMYPDTSPKHGDEIGCKGLGFRSVLNWADGIDIVTENFSVNFSEKRARSELKAYRKAHEGDETYSRELGTIDRIAVLNTAEVRESTDGDVAALEGRYATAIGLHLREDAIPGIEEQLKGVEFRELLFLKHIKEIDISLPGTERRVAAEQDGDTVVIKDSSDPGAAPLGWRMMRRAGTLETAEGEKTYELAAAYPLSEEERERTRESGVLYSYFPTKVHVPLPFLVHGTFELTENREDLMSGNELNLRLMDELTDLIAEAAERVAGENGTCDYSALKCLLPSHPVYTLDTEYGFTKKLREKTAGRRVFPSVAGGYLSLADSPRYTDTPFADVVNADRFRDLMPPCGDETVKRYIRETARIGFYGAGELVERINADADEYVARGVNAEIVFLLSKETGHMSEPPLLLVDTDGNRIGDPGVNVFLTPEGGESLSVPEWAKGTLRFMDSSLAESLRGLWGISTSRELRDRLVSCGYTCSEYSFKPVADALMKHAGDDRERAVDLVRWMFGMWDSGRAGTDMMPDDVLIVSRDGGVEKAENCHIGAEYGCDVGERIVRNMEGATFAAPKEAMGLGEEPTERVRDFLKALGASEFPKARQRKLTREECAGYLTRGGMENPWLSTVYYESYRADEILGWEFPKPWTNEKICVSFIPHIEDMLRDSDPVDILIWLLSDEDLRKAVGNRSETDEKSTIVLRPPYSKADRIVPPARMPSWLRMKFADTEWLPSKSGRRAAPSRCTMKEYGLSPAMECADVDYAALSDALGRPAKKETDALLESLGVVDDISELSEDTTYGLLLSLPSLDIRDEKTVKRVYTAINQNPVFRDAGANAGGGESKNRAEYMRRGMVLAITDGVCDYLPAGEVYYVDRKRYGENILKSIPVMPLNRRAGAGRIKKIFGVRELRDLGRVEMKNVEEHRLSGAFRDEFVNLLPYIYARIMDTDKDRAKMGRLTRAVFMLVRSAHIRLNDGKWETLNPYEFIYDDGSDGDGNASGYGTIYIQVPDDADDLRELKGRTRFQYAVSEAISTLLDVDENTDAYNLIICRTAEENEEYFRCRDEYDVLEEARLALEERSSPEDRFWRTLCRATGEPPETLSARYRCLLPDDFRFGKITRDEDIESVISLFRDLGIDVSDYNENAPYARIDIRKRNERRFTDLKNRYRGKYLARSARLLANLGGTKADFGDMESEYGLTSPKDCENAASVLFDEKTEFETLFGITTGELESENDDYDELVLSLKDGETTPVSAGDTGLSDGARPSRPAAVQQDYASILARIREETDGTVRNGVLTKEAPRTHAGSGGRRAPAHAAESRETKEMNGYAAECKVLAKLEKNRADGKIRSIRWVSANAEKSGMTKPGEGDDSLGFDIKYEDNNGEVHYVEVKSTSSNSLEFMISRNELDFATGRNRDSYELWFVFLENGEPSAPVPLGNIFILGESESFLDNDRYSVENSEYRIRARLSDAVPREPGDDDGRTG